MSEQERSGEAAVRRRRWINFGELLAVAAVAISGLTLWNSYQERTGAEIERIEERKAREAEKRARAQAEVAKARMLLLKGSGRGARLRLAPLDPTQAIQSQTIAFPSALAAPRIDTVIDPRLEAEWVERALRKAPDGKPSSGDRRLPVAIATRFVVGGEAYSDAAIYDVGYRIDADLLDRDVELIGLSLVERVPAADVQRRLDALYERRSN